MQSEQYNASELNRVEGLQWQVLRGDLPVALLV